MTVPLVAICGRPNVGKSTLFNTMIGKRVSIVDPTSGVTRDRISYMTSIEDKYFELIDTGGIGIYDDDIIDESITFQIDLAIQQAKVIIFVVDIRDGVTPLDMHVAPGAVLRSQFASP